MGSGTEAVRMSISKCNVLTFSLWSHSQILWRLGLYQYGPNWTSHHVRGACWRWQCGSAADFPLPHRPPPPASIYTPCWEPHESDSGCLHKQLEDIFGKINHLVIGPCVRAATMFMPPELKHLHTCTNTPGDTHTSMNMDEQKWKGE